MLAKLPVSVGVLSDQGQSTLRGLVTPRVSQALEPEELQGKIKWCEISPKQNNMTKTNLVQSCQRVP